MVNYAAQVHNYFELSKKMAKTNDKAIGREGGVLQGPRCTQPVAGTQGCPNNDCTFICFAKRSLQNSQHFYQQSIKNICGAALLILTTHMSKKKACLYFDTPVSHYFFSSNIFPTLLGIFILGILGACIFLSAFFP